MFADDTDFVVHHHQDEQKIITRFPKSVKAFKLKIEFNETEFMYHTFRNFKILIKTYR